jgi:activator of 2-hydroxyglutaryl-CoA dehydratase/predicted nucleotide-binding protein (sugar kinase/HSP70/actin superfamily)
VAPDATDSIVHPRPEPGTLLTVDAGVEHLRLRVHAADGRLITDELIANHGDLRRVCADNHVAGWGASADARVVITGKLATTARDVLEGGRTVLPAAAFWLAARQLMARPENAGVEKLALVDLSASGYLLVGIDRRGQLVDDLLVVNPRCGAGCGINLDRVLQKLNVPREGVDDLLAGYTGESHANARAGLSTRADRCGVFASSATVSDKNQGIPLDAALATTLKSEVLKACRKLPAGFDKVYFCGRVFRWRLARDCAEDFVRSRGVRDLEWDPENTHVLEALAARPLDGRNGAPLPPAAAPRAESTREYPGFSQIKRRYEASGHYLRLPSDPVTPPRPADVMARHVVIGLDVGSTMAKAVISDADDGQLLLLSAYSNAGDTIETVKQVFRDLLAIGIATLHVRGIGITGSARYQVQQGLARLYPSLADRLTVLVENYAHARGSIDEARRHVARLLDRGVGVNRDFCVLVDIGGEDTKISTIALAPAELYANAMNLKCSAGTGSLMDTLAALFNLQGVPRACDEAFAAPRSFAINATCAVFLMENARRLQAQGVPRDQILASANWAIVENMARTLWGQIEIPRHAVVLLHGQTMLSEPLPLAVTDRLQSYLNAPAYAIVPPYPGHRACLGLIRTMMQASPPGATEIRLASFVDARFTKRIIECHGAACGDPQARCNRTSLACQGADGNRFMFTLGGCTAINELFARRGAPSIPPPRDAYKEIWDFIASHQPHSDAPDRLVIPRSFCVTEWAYLLGRLFERLGVPVHVDDVRESDLLGAQGVFHIDTCAPHMGAVGQYRRLAGEPHGIILAPQIADLPTTGGALALTCTVNQGGVAVACNLASIGQPNARFHMFTVRLRQLEAHALADQLLGSLRDVFTHYRLTPSAEDLVAALNGAIDDHQRLRRAAADLAADLADEALAEGRPVAVVVGREYVLSPGLYDSSVRRLLRDKRMTAIPSYVLDVDPDPEFDHVYWRNPHTILTLLKAIADRTLHRQVTHPRLARVFRAIEDRDPPGPLLPVVQVSTFSCGPDSVTAHLVAEIMRRRPFLLLQSDAVLKELAHLENRVNTYVKQLELGLHGTVRSSDAEPFVVQRIDHLTEHDPLDRDHDVIYLPTMGDNRVVTAVLRAAGLTCIDTYDPQRTLADAVRQGRRYTGDAVCAPLAAVYGDLLHAVEDFTRRRERDDPLVRGRQRVLYFDNQGDGPCRQGQYAGVHQFLAEKTYGPAEPRCRTPGAALPGGALLQVLIGHEERGYNIGVEEWTLYRAYQGVIAQAVLDEMLFAGGAMCGDSNEYAGFLDDHRRLEADIHRALEAFRGPGPLGRRVIAAADRVPGLAAVMKYFVYRMDGRDLTRPIARFSRRWLRGRDLPPDHLRVHVSGEVYMRVAQARDLFGKLLRMVGFRRFRLTAAHLWPYLEYLTDWRIECSREATVACVAKRARATTSRERHECDQAIRLEHLRCRRARLMSLLLRQVLARPLYHAAGLSLPPGSRDLLETAREILPTLRPHGELGLYLGEALRELRDGVDLFLSIAPVGCMVTSMGEVLTPRILQAAGDVPGRIQSLFSADGDVSDELLEVALLKALGPERL